MKTHKTISKRIKLTKSGKLLKRKAGQNHFNARESGNITRTKRRDISVSHSYVKSMKQLI
ncbi:MAG: 50S ribosomal protein L35 [Patescibacteria group bacterium]